MEDIKDEEKISMTTSPQFIWGLDKILDFLVESKYYNAEFNKTTIKYDGIVEDTANGKAEVFTIVRKKGT